VSHHPDGFLPFTLRVPGLAAGLACAGQKRDGRWVLVAHAWPEHSVTDRDLAAGKKKLLDKVGPLALKLAPAASGGGARPPKAPEA
jgi:hypothetical protein